MYWVAQTDGGSLVILSGKSGETLKSIYVGDVILRENVVAVVDGAAYVTANGVIVAVDIR